MAATKPKAGAGAKAKAGKAKAAKARTDPAARPETPEGRARRRRVFRAWVGIAFVMAAAVAVLAPLLEAGGNMHRWVAVIAAGMAALLFLGVAWLAIYVHRRRRS